MPGVSAIFSARARALPLLLYLTPLPACGPTWATLSTNSGILAAEQRLNRLKEDWAFICKTLLLNQLDYDHLDPEILAQAQVRENGQLHSGKVAYSVIILPPLTNLESAAWEKLKKFLEKGGTVISLGLLPYEVIEQRQNTGEETRTWFGLKDYNLAGETYWEAKPGEGVAGKPAQPGPAKGHYEAYFFPCEGGVNQGTGEQLVPF